MYANAKISIYLVGIYLLKVNDENSRTRCVICLKLTKRHQNDLINIKTIRNIDVVLMSLLLALKRLHNFS